MINTTTIFGALCKRPASRRGVSIGVVLIVAIALGLIVESVLKLTLRTSHTQQDQYIWLDAKNAAEAAVEYGFAQLMDRFSKNASFPTNSLAPKNTPLSLPAQFFSTYSQMGGAWSNSTIILPSQATYNPKDTSLGLGSRTTDLVGGVVVPGTWKVIDGAIPGNELDPLKNKLVFVRNVNVFGKATATDFRNKHTTTVYAKEVLQVRDAPLFANTIFYNMDMEIAPGAAMNVYGAVHSNHDVYVMSSAGLNFHGQLTTAGKLYHDSFDGIGKAVAGGDVSFANSSGNLVSMRQSSNWVDSTTSNFTQKASQYWNGNVQTGSMGIPKLNPVAIPDYQRDNPATSTLDDQLNSAYQLIQPILPTSASGYNETIEAQKFSYKAGITIQVDSTNKTYSMYTYQRDSSGDIVYDASGNPTKITLTPGAGNDFVTVEGYSHGKTSITGGMYDARRAKNLSLVKVDMGALNALVNSDNKSDWGGSVNQQPSSWWNGVVYVQFSGAAPRSTDGVSVGIDNWGVQLVNGSTLPNPSYARANGIHGTTVATNNPLYVVGNYNADGLSSTGSGGNPDSTAEPPAALAADSITVLSTAWTNAKSDKDLSNRIASSFTEVSAAFLTGIVPSDNANNGAYSGGVENFPRFLEDWGGKTFRYRGSMVSLFESEIAAQAWGGGSIYGAPIRDWSFDKAFGTGSYPPGTPNSRSYRRINYQELTKAQWESEMAALKTNPDYQ